jgi:lysophospholipase L1-like esterase
MLASRHSSTRLSPPAGALQARFVASRLLAGLLALACIGMEARAQAPAPADPTQGRAFGAEIQAFLAADRVTPPAPCQTLFVGSSSMVKWRATLAADMAPLPVINRGFGGSTIADVNDWFDAIVAPYSPSAIVFYAGENDIDAGKSVDQVVADFDTFLARKDAALGRTPVYFISLKPSKLRFAQFSRQTAVNEAIRARARKRSDLIYVDVVPAMLEEGKPKDIFGPDGLHMNAAGYAIWTRILRAALLPQAEAEARRCHDGRRQTDAR